MKRKLIIIIAFFNVFYMFGQFDKGFNDGFTQAFRDANLYEYAGRVERNMSECNHKSYLYNGEKDISPLAKEYAAGYRCGVSQASKIIPKVEERLRNSVNTSNSNISNNQINNNASNSYDGNQEIVKMQEQTKEFIDSYMKYTNQLVQSYRRTPINYGSSISLTDGNLVPSIGDTRKETRQLANNNPEYDELMGLTKRKDWVIEQNKNFFKKDMKIEKEIFDKRQKETKENEKILQKAKGYYNFNQLTDGWYEIFLHFPYKNSLDKKEYNAIRKTFCYVENKQMTYYINADKLLQKVASFTQSNNQCSFKFQYPNLEESGYINLKIIIINPSTQNIVPQYEVPTILAVHSIASNIGKDILFIIHNKDLGITQSRLIKSYESVENPNCYSKDGVYKFYLPKGNYEYCAVSENYLKFWTNKITIDDNCELINITN